MLEFGMFRAMPALSLLLLAAASSAACGSHTEADPRTGQPAVLPVERAGMVITREEILRSGAHDAWEAIRRHGSYLQFAETNEGAPINVTHRGPDSIFMSDEVLLVVDGTRVGDPAYLTRIPAESIAKIQILSGTEATTYFGLDGANGVVLVSTTPP